MEFRRTQNLLPNMYIPMHMPPEIIVHIFWNLLEQSRVLSTYSVLKRYSYNFLIFHHWFRSPLVPRKFGVSEVTMVATVSVSRATFALNGYRQFG
jgi:hypothetical protein